MDHCHLCAQAETYLGTAPLAPQAAEDARLATLDHTLRHHRVEIDELLLRLQQRDLDRRLAAPGGTARYSSRSSSARSLRDSQLSMSSS